MVNMNTALKRTTRCLSRSPAKHLAISVLIASTTFCTAAFSNPENPVVIAGSASFDQMGNQLSITNSPGTIIDWNGFSIDRNELTRFLQQSDQSAVLNRVTGSGISNILGELLSNGKVFLVNPKWYCHWQRCPYRYSRFCWLLSEYQ